MDGHYVFVVKDHVDGRRFVKASEVLQNRIRYGFWTLGKRSANLKRLKPGDKVVFYQGGKEGGKFVGTCAVSSNPYHASQVERRLSMGFPSAALDYVLDLRSIEVWEKPKEVQDLKAKLDFIKNKGNPRGYFRGSVRSISEEDYNAILEWS